MQEKKSVFLTLDPPSPRKKSVFFKTLLFFFLLWRLPLLILSTEDDEASKDWGDTVAHGNHDGVPEDVVPEVVVGGQGDHSSPGHSEGEEDLDTGVSPHLIFYILEIFVKK